MVIPLALMFPEAGWASVSICTTTPATLASFGATDPGNGCIGNDDSFSNFSTITGMGSPSRTNSDTEIAVSNTFSAVSTPWTVTSLFTPAVAADWEASGATGFLAQSFGSLTDSQQNFISNPFYAQPDAGDAIYLDSFELISTGVTGLGTGVLGDNMNVSAVFCIGISPCTVFDEVQENVDWGQNTSTVTEYTCSVGTLASAYFSCGSASSDNPIVVTFLQPVATINVSNEMNLVTNNGSNDRVFSIANVWGMDEQPTGSPDATPEPSTFLLFGFGIAGVGLIRRRRRGKKG